MKLKISCPHYPQCRIGHKVDIEIPDMCGVSGCDKVATNILEYDNLFYKVCKRHFPLGDYPSPIEKQGEKAW